MAMEKWPIYLPTMPEKVVKSGNTRFRKRAVYEKVELLKHT
jgi:hypothetical protein